ncbi:MAG: Lrp/AsnC family transcriptional regulator [Candidatus Thorarchaeota archaeon]|nr:Lrp/AsnC family transcriptional regulator [Candidatus Thorarchaeota archaeon]
MSDPNTSIDIATPYDDLIPCVDEPSARFYVDTIRVYLGLCSGTLGLEEAIRIVESLKENPEFVKHPTDPTVLPVNETVKEQLIEHLKTLSKYNTYNADSLRSAYRLAFVDSPASPSPLDLQVLRYLVHHPTAPLVTASRDLGLGPKTVHRAIQRLQTRNGIRFSSLLDNSAFGLESTVLFFQRRSDIPSPVIESGFAEFPFTRSMAITATSELGYVSLLYPMTAEGTSILRRSIRSLTGPVFKSACLHSRIANGMQVSMDLYDNGTWVRPVAFRDQLVGAVDSDVLESLLLMEPSGPQRRLTKMDFIIASQFVMDARISPASVVQRLRSRGIRVDTEHVSQTIRRLKKRRIVIPFVALNGMGLDASFCFEIVCNRDWVNHILAATRFIPQSYYHVSEKGILLWIHIPSAHQKDYYQALRSLEDMDHVDSVSALLSMYPASSRSILDSTKSWSSGPRGWYVEPDALDLTKYLL